MVRQKNRGAPHSAAGVFLKQYSPHLSGDVAHAADDDLQDGAAVGAQQVDLIDDQQADLQIYGQESNTAG